MMTVVHLLGSSRLVTESRADLTYSWSVGAQEVGVVLGVSRDDTCLYGSQITH